MTNPETANRLPLDSITLSKLLQNDGYARSFMGKWHLGYAPYIPESYGFGHVVGGRAFKVGGRHVGVINDGAYWWRFRTKPE